MDMAGDGQRRDTQADNSSVSIKNIKFLHNLSNTFAGAMTGLGLVFVAIFVLFLNETSIVVSSQRINDKLKTVAGLESIHRVLQENNNKLVYITGQLRTNQPLTDGQFGIEAHVLKLRREVQMFQWIEHTRSSSESGSNPSEINTVYTKEWRSEAVASESFLKPDRHQNKKEFPVKSTTFVATHAYVGSYYIKENLKEKMEEFHPLPTLQPNDEYNIEFHNGWYYQKGVATHPDVGDVRARFLYCGVSGQDDNPLGPAQDVSILAKQINGQLTRYRKGNERLDVVHFGKKTAKELIVEDMNISTGRGWTLRLGGFILLVIGFSLANNIIYQLASFVPEVQDFFLVNPLRFHLLASLCLLLLITILCWISLKLVILLVMSLFVFIPFVILVKFGSVGQKKASSKV
ncbi:transmembrane protein 43-like isoform X2 [Apostichopus japonicus]